MKRIFAIMLGIGLILLTSCQQKDLEKKVVTGEGNVTLTVCASDALLTKAALDLNSNLGGISNVDRAVYYLRYKLAVYFDGELVIEPQTQMSNSFAGVTYSLSLVEGDTYTIVCWADFVKDSSGATDLHYDTSDLSAITCLDAADAQLNDESRDAYFASEQITVEEENASASITLRRPFAKLRIVTTDWDEAGTGMPDAIDISYHDCTRFSSLNALTGAVTGEEITSAQAYSATINVASKDYDGGYDAIEGYRTLAVDYLLAESEVSAIHLSYETFRNSVETHTYDIVEDIPIERNYITTIIGDLLTTNDNIKISIDEDFEGEYTYELGKFTSDATDTYEYEGTNYPVVYIGTDVTLTTSITAATSWTWTSSDESIATVADGVVTGLTEGLVTITAKCETDDGIQVCSGKLYVMAAEAVPGGISLDETAATISIEGDYTISYSVPAGASQTLTWTSSDATVLTVSGGVITPTGFGTATVTVTSSAEEIDEDGGYAASAELAVTIPYGYYNSNTYDILNSSWEVITSGASWEAATNSAGESYCKITSTAAGRCDFAHPNTQTGNATNDLGDFDMYIDPVNYPIVCYRIDNYNDKDGYTCNITFDVTSSDGSFNGNVYNKSNGWSYKYLCSDNSAILVYDMSERKIGADNSSVLSETTSFKSFQMKYADIKYNEVSVTEAQTVNFYWFKTFKDKDALESALDEWSAETGITYSAN